MKAPLFLQRFYTDNCTRGRLIFDDHALPADIRALVSSFNCFTLELPWRNNKQNISCIPEGTYKLVPHNTESYPGHVGISGIPGRSAVLFHVGNTVRDSRGCPMLGENVEGCKLNNSATSVEEFNKLYIELMEMDVECELQIYTKG